MTIERLVPHQEIVTAQNAIPHRSILITDG
jgi:hypothetical protein